MNTANQYYKMQETKAIIECARNSINKKNWMVALEFIDVITNILVNNSYHKNIKKTEEAREKIFTLRKNKGYEVVNRGITKASAMYCNAILNLLEKFI